jgi:hypothetical protein
LGDRGHGTAAELAGIRPAAAGSTATIRILAIAGTGQNGSTLASRLLGELPGFTAVGEVGRLWDKGLIEHVACSCGEPVPMCGFWRAIGDAAFGGWDEVDAAAATRLRDSLALKGHRLQHPFAIPFLLAPGLWPSFGLHLEEYRALMASLYRGVHRVAPGDVIVDAMKIPAHVYMLSGLGPPEFDVRFVHLIRDSRGVAHSNAKLVVRQGSDEARPYRGRRGPLKSSVRWTWFNLSSDLLRVTKRVPMITVRYEDLVRDPAREVGRMAALMDATADRDLAYLRGNVASLSPGHLVAGNRMRLASGPVTIAEDEAWRAALPPRSRRIVTAVTWPMLRRYRYLPTSTTPPDGMAASGSPR